MGIQRDFIVVGTGVVAPYANLTANVYVGNSTSYNYINSTAIVTVGAPLAIVGDTSFTNNVTVSGNLNVQGTVTYINSATLSVGDNIITLNADITGAPSENAGIEVNRGSSANSVLRWNETSDTWEITNNGLTYGTIHSKLADIVLGTDTSGNYVATLTQGTGVTITNNSGEGATPTIAIGQAVGTGDAVTFGRTSVGSATANAVTTSNSISVSNTSGSANITAFGLTVGGSVINSTGITATGTLNITGAATLSNSVTITGAAGLSNTLTVTGNGTFSNQVSITGNTQLANTLNVVGNVVLQNTMTVTGLSTFSNINFGTANSSNLIRVGANVVVNTTAVFVSNSTSNVTITNINIGGNANAQLNIVNAALINTGSVSINSTAVVLGTGGRIFANSSAGTLGKVLTSNGSGVYWGDGGVNIIDDTSTIATYYPMIANSTGGVTSNTFVSSTKLTYMPSTGELYSTIVKTTNLQDSSGRQLIILDSTDSVVWGG